MKKVLIMGGSYFIGKHVVNALKKDYEVYVLNRGNHPFNDPLIHELICDRNDQEKLTTVLSSYRFHYIVDISGYTAIQSTILLHALNTNLLEKYVYISTSAVYQDKTESIPYKEDDALGGLSFAKDYAINKIEAENTLKARLKPHQLVIFRPPYVYGEDNYILRERLIFYLIEHNLPVYIPKSNNRFSLVYVNDLAKEVKLSFEGKIPSGTYNVGNKDSLTFKEWVTLCAKVMKKEAILVFIDVNNHQLKVHHFFPYVDIDLVLNVDKIKAYSPLETPFDIGLELAYQDYLTLKEPLTLPEKMIKTRAKISQLIHD